jgi:hypothetical protein
MLCTPSCQLNQHAPACLQETTTHLAGANVLCDELTSQLQQLVADYKQTRQQLGAVGQQLSQAREQLNAAKEQLQGPPLHSQYNKLAQVSSRDLVQQLCKQLCFLCLQPVTCTAITSRVLCNYVTFHAQACTDLDAALLRLAQLQHSQDMSLTRSSSCSSSGSSSSSGASQVGQALQDMQRHLQDSSASGKASCILSQVRQY